MTPNVSEGHSVFADVIWFDILISNIQTFLGVLKYFLGSLYILTPAGESVQKTHSLPKFVVDFFAYGQSHSTVSLRFRVYRLSLWP